MRTIRVTEQFVKDQHAQLKVLNRYLSVLRNQLKSVQIFAVPATRNKMEFYCRYRIKETVKLRNRVRNRLYGWKRIL